MYAPAIDDLVIGGAELATPAGGDLAAQLEIIEIDLWELLTIEASAGWTGSDADQVEDESERKQETPTR